MMNTVSTSVRPARRLHPAGTVACVLAVVCGLGVWAPRGSCAAGGSTADSGSTLPSPPLAGTERICLSLKVLGRQARQALVARKRLPEEVRTLAGLGWVEGYILDPENEDVVLVGRRSPAWPVLHLDDLVVNMRSVWEDGSYPYCSLDPRPEDIRELQRLFNKMGSLHSLEDRYRWWMQLEGAVGPQMVVVGGVPLNSREAHVMITADYHMKQVSQGRAHVPGIVSSIDRSLADYREGVRSGTAQPQGRETMSRFWFHVGDGSPTFQEDDGIVWIHECPLVLLTERQRAGADGVLADSGEEDPKAQAFAREFSQRFNEAALAEPIYADLANLYRLSAVLRALHFRDGARKAGLDLTMFLREYPYQEEVPMPKFLPGLTNLRMDQQLTQDGVDIYFNAVCGGVSMDVSVRPEQFRADAGQVLVPLTTRARASRPSKDTLYWVVG